MSSQKPEVRELRIQLRNSQTAIPGEILPQGAQKRNIGLKTAAITRQAQKFKGKWTPAPFFVPAGILSLLLFFSQRVCALCVPDGLSRAKLASDFWLTLQCDAQREGHCHRRKDLHGQKKRAPAAFVGADALMITSEGSSEQRKFLRPLLYASPDGRGSLAGCHFLSRQR